ncbi:MAG: FAD-binding oxidoreductase [Woeseiaceae bacterium]|nr:FAD-binding oxidoreductase [Woeseiaceae bacterium]
MSANPKDLRRSGRMHLQRQFGPAVLRPLRVNKLREAVSPESKFSPPFRPMGAGSAATECTTASAGTVIDMTGLNEIKNIDAYADTVTVQAGVRIGDLARELAESGLELSGGHDLMSRTVGGAIAGACIGPSFGDDGAFFASQVRSLRVIAPNGKPLTIRQDQPNLLNAFRMSFGMLGTIYEATLNVRPMRPFSANHRRCNFDQFSEAAEKLGRLDVGLKFFLLPFRDRVYLDLRRYTPAAKSGHRLPWKLKDWGESTVLPNVVKSLNRFVPVAGVRYRLIDEVSQMTQGLVNNRLVASGCNATAQISSTGEKDSDLYYSTWFFPAADFAVVVQAYRDFCYRIRETNDYRCDLPTVGFRIGCDASALLSPSFDEPMIALRAMSTQAKGWEDFVIDFGEFARHWGGVPVFNQTRDIPPDYPAQVFGSRMTFFKNIRRRFDPENRMMNPFLSQYFL